jgi:hypothetical protein
MEITKDIKDRIEEIHFEVYNAEDSIDGVYSIKMFGDTIPEIDKAHNEVLTSLRNYLKILEKYK